MSMLLEPFHYEFFQNAMVVATLSGALCGLVGVFVVLRGMSYIGHGLSHAIFGGAVASYVVDVNFYLGAGAWGVAAALLINKVAARRSLGADAAIGVVTTASFAVGLALISRSGGFTRNFEAALFGNVLGVQRADVVAVLIVTALAVAFFWFGYMRLLFATFDPDVAEVSGINTGRVDLLLALTVAATVAVSMNLIGVTVIAAVLVMPAATARLLTDRFAFMLPLSMGLGAGACLLGVYASYYADISSGAAVVLVAAALFTVAFIWSGIRSRSRTALRSQNA